jgi:hypothetical protein
MQVSVADQNSQNDGIKTVSIVPIEYVYATLAVIALVVLVIVGYVLLTNGKAPRFNQLVTLLLLCKLGTFSGRRCPTKSFL